MFNYVNQKVVGEVTYTAYRDSTNPKNVKVVLSTGEEVFPPNFKEYWSNL